jgi:hypothetical protein
MAKIEFTLPDGAEELFYIHNAQIFYQIIKDHAKWLKIYAKEDKKIDAKEAYKNLIELYKEKTGIALR